MISKRWRIDSIFGSHSLSIGWDKKLRKYWIEIYKKWPYYILPSHENVYKMTVLCNMCLCCPLQVYIVPSVLHAVHVVLGDELHHSSGSGDIGRSIRLLLLDDGQVEPGQFSSGPVSVESTSVSVCSYVCACVPVCVWRGIQNKKIQLSTSEIQLKFNWCLVELQLWRSWKWARVQLLNLSWISIRVQPAFNLLNLNWFSTLAEMWNFCWFPLMCQMAKHVPRT